MRLDKRKRGMRSTKKKEGSLPLMTNPPNSTGISKPKEKGNDLNTSIRGGRGK